MDDLPAAVTGPLQDALVRSLDREELIRAFHAVTEGLIRDSIAAAAERRMPIQIHAAQSISEFHEIVRRTGLTAVQWLDKLGFLGPRASLGHGIFLDHHPWVRWPTRTDLGRLAETGTSVAHWGPLEVSWHETRA